MVKPEILFWPEVSRNIATGHLMECLALSNWIQGKGIKIRYLVDNYSPAVELLRHRLIHFEVADIESGIGKIENSACVIVNHRHVMAETLEAVETAGKKVFVIDQLGHKRIICDVLVNSSPVPEWHKYKLSSRQKPEMLLGPRYAIMRPEFSEFHKKQKSFSSNFPKILVAMGGVDRTGATLRLVKAFSKLDGHFKKEIVLGNAFAHFKAFQNLIHRFPDPSMHWVQGIRDMAKRLHSADIVITSGGNTLVECACVGTPTIVLWEDPHEDRLGKAFEEKGCAVNIGNGIITPISHILESMQSLLADTGKRRLMSKMGRKIVDGHGCDRVGKRLIELAKQ